MKETTLLKIALIVSLAGLVLLYFASDKLVMNESTVEKITRGNIGEVVKISGVINSVRTTDAVTFLTIEKTGEIKVIIFEPLDYLEQGMYVEVVGEIEEYKGEREVIGNALRLLR